MALNRRGTPDLVSYFAATRLTAGQKADFAFWLMFPFLGRWEPIPLICHMHAVLGGRGGERKLVESAVLCFKCLYFLCLAKRNLAASQDSDPHLRYSLEWVNYRVLVICTNSTLGIIGLAALSSLLYDSPSVGRGGVTAQTGGGCISRQQLAHLCVPNTGHQQHAAS